MKVETFRLRRFRKDGVIMAKDLTVGELKKALEGVPDSLEVRLSSDTGVDQGIGRIIIESARRVQYNLPEGKRFEDGSTGVDYFDIYANDIEDFEESEE